MARKKSQKTTKNASIVGELSRASKPLTFQYLARSKKKIEVRENYLGENDGGRGERLLKNPERQSSLLSRVCRCSRAFRCSDCSHLLEQPPLFALSVRIVITRCSSWHNLLRYMPLRSQVPSGRASLERFQIRP